MCYKSFRDQHLMTANVTALVQPLSTATATKHIYIMRYLVAYVGVHLVQSASNLMIWPEKAWQKHYTIVHTFYCTLAAAAGCINRQVQVTSNLPQRRSRRLCATLPMLDMQCTQCNMRSLV